MDKLSRSVTGKCHGAEQGKIMRPNYLIVFSTLDTCTPISGQSNREKLFVVSWTNLVFRIMLPQNFA